MSEEYIIMIPFVTYKAAKTAADNTLLEYKIVKKNHPWFTKLKEYVKRDNGE